MPPPGQIGHENPRNKRLRRATSPDGLGWTPLPDVLAESASSPQLVSLAGVDTVFFVRDGNHVARIPWEGGPVEDLSFEGPGLVVDPHVVGLPDGTWRLYYIFQDKPMDPGQAPQNEVRSARSPDGHTWTREPGVRVTTPAVDPDVVALPDGTWRMYLTRNAADVLSYRSQDGLRFTEEPGQRLAGGGVTSTLWAQERWWQFFHQRYRIFVAWSADGLQFQPHPTPLLEPAPDGVESPTVAWDRDTGWRMVYALVPRGGP